MQEYYESPSICQTCGELEAWEDCPACQGEGGQCPWCDGAGEVLVCGCQDESEE